MADVSLYLTNVTVSVGRDANGGVDAERPRARSRGQDLARDFESVELGTCEVRQREKPPRRVIHFSSGETMEEYSTDEEEGEEEDGDEEGREPERKDLLASPVDASKMTWGPYFWFHMWRAATSTISACDYLGERMASLFGITSAKYQYAIDEYYRMKKEREEEKEENRLSEVAGRSFRLQSQEELGQRTAAADQPEVDATYQIQNENQAPSNSIVVPAIISAS